MKKLCTSLLLVLGYTLLSAQPVPVEKANYELAARFSPDNLKRMVFSTSVDPHWLKNSPRFWYTYETSEGKFYYLVDPVRRTKDFLFDNVKMAADMSRLTLDPFDAQHLFIDNLEFINNETALRFEVRSKLVEEEDQEDATGKTQEQEKDRARMAPKKMKPKTWYFEYNLNFKQLRLLEDYEKPKDKPAWANISPNEEYVLFARNYNLYWMDKANLKAGDGITDLYGVMYKPFDFDPNKKYPIIAYLYPGPQTESVYKSFSASMDRTDRQAQLGFIVVTIGNRGGHPSRSKWYHNYGYGNLRDYGLEDKKVAIEQLAARHHFIDIQKVGIFGHSGGGFMSTAAMLVYPDFFKVAVSSAGNHENNIYNRWWSEKHHGVEEITDNKGNINFKYDIDKNSELAKNLKGRLLICTGDIDNNVHPANTIRLANALIKANKRFDFFIFPGQRHGFGSMNEYFFWLRSDYFAKHLIGDYQDSVDILQINQGIPRNK